MAKFEVLMQEYKLEPSHAADEGYECITIHAAGVNKSVERLLTEEETRVETATKLYVVGKWDSYFPPDPVRWREDVEQVCVLIRNMAGLKQLTWISDLPFMQIVWDALPKSLSKIIVDISHPVDVEYNHPSRKKYITLEGMKPLIQFTNLRELRVFGMRDSFQSIIWETVFKNEANDKGMHVLDLKMAEKPLVRASHWVAAEDVKGLKVRHLDGGAYKGLDGRGVLHYAYGTGEYLDDYAMRKARMAISRNKPLPLWCIKLDGFVIDQLPFDHELSKVVLLTCGKNCIDAGLRAPKTSLAQTLNMWGPSVNNEHTHCLIVWPNFAAIFDNEGNRLDSLGNIAESEPPTPIPVPLTDDHLDLKNLADSLETVQRRDSKGYTLVSSPVQDTPSSGESDLRLRSTSTNASHGSYVPTPSTLSEAPTSESDGAEIDTLDKILAA